MEKTNKNIKLLKLWIPVAIWMILIFLMSNRTSLKASYFDPLDFVIKKTAHVTEYAILLILLFRAFYQSWRKKFDINKLENYAIIITQIYAISDEWHQSHIAGRTATIRDMFIDFVGVMIGVIIIKLIKEHKKLVTVKKLIYGSN